MLGLCLEALMGLLQAEIRGSLRGGCQQNIHQGVPFRVVVSTDWPVPGQEVVSIAAGPGIAGPSFAAFLDRS